jgi:hypothetical protein
VDVSAGFELADRVPESVLVLLTHCQIEQIR